MPEFYAFDSFLVCPMCGMTNAEEVTAKSTETTTVLRFFGTRRWRPRRWFRKVGYHACRCHHCGAQWRELPCGDKGT